MPLAPGTDISRLNVADNVGVFPHELAQLADLLQHDVDRCIPRSLVIGLPTRVVVDRADDQLDAFLASCIEAFRKLAQKAVWLPGGHVNAPWSMVTAP